MSGRTEWLPKDAGWHRRGRIVELGQRHGGAAVNAFDWLACEARTQNPVRNGKGEVKTGYAAVAHGAFLGSIEEAAQVVQTCVEIGLLDDFDALDDRTFRARISGWNADVNLTLEASRKAAERSGTNWDNAGQPGTDAQNVPERPESSPTQHNTTREEEAKASSSEIAKATSDQVRLCRLLADLVCERDPRAKPAPESAGWLRPMRLLLADRDGDAAEIERVLRWSQSDPFWQTIVLSPLKLRKQFTALTIKMKAAPIRSAAGSGTTRPAWPQDDEVAALVRDIFPPATDGDRARQVVLAAWGMGHHEPPAILEWAAKTDPELLDPAA